MKRLEPSCSPWSGIHVVGACITVVAQCIFAQCIFVPCVSLIVRDDMSDKRRRVGVEVGATGQHPEGKPKVTASSPLFTVGG